MHCNTCNAALPSHNGTMAGSSEQQMCVVHHHHPAPVCSPVPVAARACARSPEHRRVQAAWRPHICSCPFFYSRGLLLLLLLLLWQAAPAAAAATACAAAIALTAPGQRRPVRQLLPWSQDAGLPRLQLATPAAHSPVTHDGLLVVQRRQQRAAGWLHARAWAVAAAQVRRQVLRPNGLAGSGCAKRLLLSTVLLLLLLLEI